MSNGNRASSKASTGKNNRGTPGKKWNGVLGKGTGLQKGYEKAPNGKVRKTVGAKGIKVPPKPLDERDPKKKNNHHPYIIKDEYFYEAKRQGYRARSAFKLKELQELFSLISKWDTVLDLASAPGSFLQVIHEIVGNETKMMGVDLQKVEHLGYPNLKLLQADIFDYPVIEREIRDFGVEKFDVITSDIAPSTTGLTGVDQYRSIELNIAVLDVARQFLKPNGNLLLKVFVGEDIDDLIQPIKAQFTTLKRHKPKACRDRSFEEYFICIGMKKE